MSGVQVGDRAPDVTLAQLRNDVVEPVRLASLLAARRAVIVGVPGAFTPICTRRHIPEFIEQAPRLRASGFDVVACVTPNNPWVTEAWGRSLDPGGQVTFYSDGNLALARALHATLVDYANFLGETSGRFLLVAHSGVIKHFALEPHPAELTCTRPREVWDL